MESLNDQKSALEYLVNTGSALHKAQQTPTVLDIEGRKYLFHHDKAEEIEKEDDYSPDSLDIYTLIGLSDWIHADPDHLFADKENPCIVCVDDPTSVTILSPLTPVKRKRNTIAVCRYAPPRVRYDNYMDAEDFGIMLQTNFIEDQNRDLVLKIARNMTEEQSAQTADDGVSQRVTFKSGVKEVDSTVFRNPAYLRPMRTFPEISQPCSPFVIRFKEGHMAAVFEADGGAWKNDAVKLIGAWLKDNLADTNVVVIA